MIKRGKKGNIRMRGDENTIFTDVVRIVDAYCISNVEIFENVDETALLTAIVLAVAKEGDSEICFERMRKTLKKAND